MKKLLVVILSILALASLTFGLVGCKDNECTHDYEVEVINPTCTEEGFTRHTCKKCNKVIEDTFVAAKGHSWVNGAQVKDSTFSRKAEYKLVCKDCGAVKENETGKTYRLAEEGVLTVLQILGQMDMGITVKDFSITIPSDETFMTYQVDFAEFFIGVDENGDIVGGGEATLNVIANSQVVNALSGTMYLSEGILYFYGHDDLNKAYVMLPTGELYAYLDNYINNSSRANLLLTGLDVAGAAYSILQENKSALSNVELNKEKLMEVLPEIPTIAFSDDLRAIFTAEKWFTTDFNEQENELTLKIKLDALKELNKLFYENKLTEIFEGLDKIPDFLGYLLEVKVGDLLSCFGLDEILRSSSIDVEDFLNSSIKEVIQTVAHLIGNETISTVADLIDTIIPLMGLVLDNNIYTIIESVGGLLGAELDAENLYATVNAFLDNLIDNVTKFELKMKQNSGVFVLDFEYSNPIEVEPGVITSIPFVVVNVTGSFVEYDLAATVSMGGQTVFSASFVANLMENPLNAEEKIFTGFSAYIAYPIGEAKGASINASFDLTKKEILDVTYTVLDDDAKTTDVHNVSVSLEKTETSFALKGDYTLNEVSVIELECSANKSVEDGSLTSFVFTFANYETEDLVSQFSIMYNKTLGLFRVGYDYTVAVETEPEVFDYEGKNFALVVTLGEEIGIKIEEDYMPLITATIKMDVEGPAISIELAGGIKLCDINIYLMYTPVGTNYESAKQTVLDKVAEFILDYPEYEGKILFLFEGENLPDDTVFDLLAKKMYIVGDEPDDFDPLPQIEEIIISLVMGFLQGLIPSVI